MKIPAIKIPKPFLDIQICTGWVNVRTEVWRQVYERQEFVYISLYWKVFKWNGRFGLYRPDEALGLTSKEQA